MSTTDKQAVDEWSVARSINPLAEYLPEEKKELFLERIRLFEDKGARVRALIGIANAFPESQSNVLRREAYETACSIENPWLRCRALINVAHRLPEHKLNALSEAVSAVSQMPSEYHRARALAGLGGLIPDELSDNALKLIRSIEDDSLRMMCLAFYACHLAEDERMEVFKALTSLSGDFMRLQAVLTLSEELPSQPMGDILEYARGLTKPEVQAHALLTLAPKFPEEEADIQQMAFSAALQVTNPYDRTEFLSQLASTLPDPDRSDLIQKEMAAVRNSGDVLLQVYGLQALARCLAEEDRPAVMHEIIRSAQAIDDDGLRAEVLVSFLNEVPDDERAHLISEILSALEQLSE